MQTPEMQIDQSPLGRRLVAYTILFSSLITLVLTVVQLHREYRLDLDAIDTRFTLTERSYLQSIREALWTTDRESVRLQLRGILQFPDMQYAEVRENGEVWAAAGEKKSGSNVSRTYPVVYRHRGEDLVIGMLSVVASLDGVYQRIIDRAIVILFSNGLKTFLVALFVLFIVHRLISRHVLRIADLVAEEPEDSGEPIRLARKPGGRKDELDHLVENINRMRKRVSKSMAWLRASEERYRKLVSLTSDWDWEQDVEGRFTHSGRRGDVVVDADADYVRGKRRQDLPGAEPDGGTWKEYLDTIEKRLPLHNFGYRALDSRGKLRHMIINGQPVFDDAGRIQGYQGTAKDDTEKLEAERRAEREHHRLVDAIESLKDGFILFDASDRILLRNSAHVRLFGLDEDVDLEGKTYEALLHLAISRGLVDTGGVGEEKWVAQRLEEHRNPGGAHDTRLTVGRWLRVNHARTSEGGYVSIFTDITRRKDMETVLAKRADRLRSLIRICARIATDIDLDATLRNIAAEAASLMEIDGAGFRLVRGDILIRAACHGLAEKVMISRELNVGESLSGIVVQQNQLIAVEDVQEDERFAPVHRRAAVEGSVKAFLGVPLRYRGKVIGALGIYGKERRVFGAEDIALFESFADQASIAIENARLFEQANHHLKKLSAEVAERERVERALRANQAMFREAERLARLGHWEWDVEKNRLASCSEECARINGMSVSETLEAFSSAESMLTTIHLEDRAGYREVAHTGEVDGEMSDQEFRIVRPDGTIRHVRELAEPIVDEGGKVVRVRGTVQDITERKELESALRERESQLQSIFDHSPVEIFLKDRDGRFVRANKEFERRFNLRSDDLIGKLPADAYDSELAESVRAEDLSVLGSGKPVVVENCLILPCDGREHFLLSVKFPIFDDGGEITGVGAIVTDITEQERAEQALRRSEQELRLITDSLPTLIVYMDSELRYRFVNKTTEEWFCRPQQSILGTHVGDMLGDQYCQKLKPRLEKALQGEGQRFDSAIDYPDGRHRDVNITYVPKIDTDGSVCGVYGMVMDVTEQKHAERELKARARELQLVTDNLPVLVAFIDAAGKYRFVNKVFEEWHGIRRDEVIGRHVEEILTGTDFAKLAAFRDKAFRGEEQSFDIELTYPDGATRHQHSTYIPEKDADGNVTGAYAMALDISKRKEMENTLRYSRTELHKALEEREQLSRDLHDGTLQAIYAAGLELDDIRTQMDVAQPQVGQRIEKAIASLNRVIRELRKHITGKSPSVLSSSQLRAQLREIAESTDGPGRMGFGVDVEPTAASCLSPDAAYDLVNITREAVSNCMRHSQGKNGFISLRLADRNVRLTVTDDGVGFDPKLMRRNGNGLGNIAARAARIGGSVDINSSSGIGTTITVDIPVKLLSQVPMT